VELGKGFLQQHGTALVILAWLCGAALLGTRILCQNLRFAKRIRNADLITDPKILDILQACKRQLGLGASITLLQTEAVRTPGLYGYFRPKLLLPRRMIYEFGERELRHIFLHELSHVKRHDMLMHWLSSALRVVHWFNPVVRYGFRRMAADRELACDELALSRAETGEARSYGETILKLLERCPEQPLASAMVGILEDSAEVERRISMIARFKRRQEWSIYGVLILVLLGLVTLTDAGVEIQPTEDQPGPERQSPINVSADNPASVPESQPKPKGAPGSLADLEKERLVTMGRLAQLREQGAGLLENYKYKEAHPVVQSLRGQIAQLERQKANLDGQIEEREEADRQAARKAFLQRYGLVDSQKPPASSSNTPDAEAFQRAQARETFLRRYGLSTGGKPSSGAETNQASVASQQALMSRYGLGTQPAIGGGLGVFGSSIGFSNRNVPLVVLVDAQGKVRLGHDDQPVELEELKGKLEKEVESNPELRLQITADRMAPFGQIIKIMDTAKDAKVKAVDASTTDAEKR